MTYIPEGGGKLPVGSVHPFYQPDRNNPADFIDIPETGQRALRAGVLSPDTALYPAAPKFLRENQQIPSEAQPFTQKQVRGLSYDPDSGKLVSYSKGDNLVHRIDRTTFRLDPVGFQYFGSNNLGGVTIYDNTIYGLDNSGRRLVSVDKDAWRPSTSAWGNNQNYGVTVTAISLSQDSFTSPTARDIWIAYTSGNAWLYRLNDGTQFDTGLTSVTDFEFLPDGTILIVGGSFGSPYAHIINRSGVIQSSITLPAGILSSYGCTFDGTDYWFAYNIEGTPGGNRYLTYLARYNAAGIEQEKAIIGTEDSGSFDWDSTSRNVFQPVGGEATQLISFGNSATQRLECLLHLDSDGIPRSHTPIERGATVNALGGNLDGFCHFIINGKLFLGLNTWVFYRYDLATMAYEGSWDPSARNDTLTDAVWDAANNQILLVQPGGIDVYDVDTSTWTFTFDRSLSGSNTTQVTAMHLSADGYLYFYDNAGTDALKAWDYVSMIADNPNSPIKNVTPDITIWLDSIGVFENPAGGSYTFTNPVTMGRIMDKDAETVLLTGTVNGNNFYHNRVASIGSLIGAKEEIFLIETPVSASNSIERDLNYPYYMIIGDTPT